MLAFDDDAALCHLLIAATAVPANQRGRWLQDLADRLDPPPGLSKAAERQRAHRARLKAGRMVLAIEVDDVLVPAALAEAGFLDLANIEDREAVARAVERLIVTVTHNAADTSTVLG